MLRIIQFFLQPPIFALSFAIFSILALTMALVAEHVYGLEPCILCIYQRVPFVLTTLLGLTAYKLNRKNNPRGAAIMIILGGVFFLANSALAFYHVGVEQHWWVSAFEACTFDPNNIREAALNPPVPCDQIPWVDPIIGWSMAAWNVVVCGVAGVKCLFVGALVLKKN